MNGSAERVFFSNFTTFLQTLRGQTVLFSYFERVPQQTKIGFDALSAKLRFFFDLLGCFGF